VVTWCTCDFTGRNGTPAGLFGVHGEAALGLNEVLVGRSRGFLTPKPPRLVLRIVFLLCQKRRSTGTNFELGIESAFALR